MKALPFDPAEYLDSEEAIAAYMADARQDGPQAISRAVEVIARARALVAQRMAADAPRPTRTPSSRNRQNG